MGRFNPQLASYIAAAKAQGAADAFVVEMLERAGWPRKEVFAAFESYYSQLTGMDLPRRISGVSDSARDAFLYLLSFGTLSVWTIGLCTLLFTLIDTRFADPVFQNRYINIRDTISGSMSSLIVGFPIYLITTRILVRDLSRKPEKAESSVRKWLTYVALLASAATLIGDLVTFVNYFLRGEFTTPFVLKVLTVFVVAGGVFWYYMAPMERAKAES